MIIIPFTGEQYRNGLRAEKAKIGKILNFDDIDANTLENLINEMRANGSNYYQTLKQFESGINSSPLSPLKEAIFWIEDTINNKAKSKIETPQLSSFQLYGFDVAAFYLSIILSWIIFWIICITCIVRRSKAKKDNKKFKYY